MLTSLGKIVEWAEDGNADAQAQLAACYSGDYDRFYEKAPLNPPKDYKKAVYWAQQAASQENALGMAYLGYFYQEGYGVEKDIEEATRWYFIAAQRGNIHAQLNIAGIFEEQYQLTENYAWLCAAASQGSDEALLKKVVMETGMRPSLLRATRKMAKAYLEINWSEGNVFSWRKQILLYFRGIICAKQYRLKRHPSLDTSD